VRSRHGATGLSVWPCAANPHALRGRFAGQRNCCAVRATNRVGRWSHVRPMSALGHKRTREPQNVMSDLPRRLLQQSLKRRVGRVLSKNAVSYIFQSFVEPANWIRMQGTQTCLRETGTINLSLLGMRIFSAPSSNRGNWQILASANFFGVSRVRYGRSVTTNIPKCSIGYATIITILAPRLQATRRRIGQRAIAPMTI
jgi:hypothetical protein